MTRELPEDRFLIRYESYADVDDEEWRMICGTGAPKFSPYELRSPDTNEVVFDRRLLSSLHFIRRYTGPITVNSAYRTKGYNANVGGGSMSYHLYGKAVDISLRGHDRYEVLRRAIESGIKGIGIYSQSEGDFMHLDMRDKPHIWMQDNRGKPGRASIQLGAG